MDMDDEHAAAVADEIVQAYRGSNAVAATVVLGVYVGTHGTEHLPAMWHHLARTIAHAYRDAGCRVLASDPSVTPLRTNKYDVHDDHARELVVRCQQHPVDARDTIRAYATSLDKDTTLWIGITLYLADRVARPVNVADWPTH